MTELWDFDALKYKMGITDVVEDYLPFHMLPVLIQERETPFEGIRVSVQKVWGVFLGVCLVIGKKIGSLIIQAESCVSSVASTEDKYVRVTKLSVKS